VEQELVAGQAAEFFDGQLIVAARSIYSTSASLTITTPADTCSAYPAAGASVWVPVSDGDAWYRLTVFSLNPPDRMTIRIEGLIPQGESDPADRCVG